MEKNRVPAWAVVAGVVILVVVIGWIAISGAQKDESANMNKVDDALNSMRPKK
jgi:hypothetical protein